MAAEPWQTAEIPGPAKALVIKKPEVVIAMLKKAKRPILVVGHEATEVDLGDGKLIDYVIDVARTAEIPVVATAHIVGEFNKRGFQPDAWMPLVDIAQRIGDPTWEGLDGLGIYDLAMFVGFPYYMEWLILSGLKHFAPHLTTISLDRFYQPHAAWSFPNVSVKDWKTYFEAITMKLGGKM